MHVDVRKQREQSYHDQRFGDGADPRQSLDALYRLMLPASLRYHQVVEGYAHRGRVLEYGCGNGENTLVFARRGVDITGIDISPKGVAHARAMAARGGLPTAFQVMDAENLAFADNSFAAVCGKGILHHVRLDRALGEIARVLVPDGRAVFIEPLGHNPLINWYRRRTPQARTPDEMPLRLSDLARAKTYFRSTQYTFFNLATLCTLAIRNQTLFDRLFPWCARLDAVLFRAAPWLRRHAWMVFMDLRQPVKTP